MANGERQEGTAGGGGMSDQNGVGAWGWVFLVGIPLGIVFWACMATLAFGATHIIGNDRGGLVRERATQIEAIRQAGDRVEIRGRRCLSSCTMYLGLENVCVSAKTTFGFHGPTYYGKALAPDRFEYWSTVMADHYPAPIRDWFMAKGRYKTKGTYKFKGSKIIDLGTAECQT